MKREVRIEIVIDREEERGKDFGVGAQDGR